MLIFSGEARSTTRYSFWCFSPTVRGNECLWWQRSTLAKGSTIVWIAEAETEAEATQSFRGLTERRDFSRGRSDVYAGLCLRKAVIMSFTPHVWLSCESLTHFICGSLLLRLACGLAVPVHGRRMWGCGFLLLGLLVKRGTSYDGRNSYFFLKKWLSVYHLCVLVLLSHDSLSKNVSGCDTE